MPYEPIHDGTKATVFICECGDLSHMMLITPADDTLAALATPDEGTFMNIYLEDGTFVDRLKTAWTLIKGKERKYGDFSSFLIRAADYHVIADILRPRRRSWDKEKHFHERETTLLRFSDEHGVEDWTFGYGLVARLEPEDHYDEQFVEDNQLVINLQYDRSKSFWWRVKMALNHLLHGKPSKHMGNWVEFLLTPDVEQYLYDAMMSAHWRYTKKMAEYV